MAVQIWLLDVKHIHYVCYFVLCIKQCFDIFKDPLDFLGE